MKSEMKKLLTEKNAVNLLNELIQGSASAKRIQKFEEETGLKFEFITEDRTEGSGDYDGWQWVFKLNDQHYALDGYYSSYDGAEMDGGVLDAYEVKSVEKTIIVWEAE